MRAIFYSLLLGAFLCLVYLGSHLFGSQGLEVQKSTYAKMQSVELDFRKRNIPTPYFMDAENDLRLVALAAEDPQFPYLWLALNRENPDDANGIFVMTGQPSRKLICGEVRQVLIHEPVAPSVATYLHGICGTRI